MMPQLLAHLFGDYILQSDWMAQGKTLIIADNTLHLAINYAALRWL